MDAEKLSRRNVLSALAVMLMCFAVWSCGVVNPDYVLPNICKQLEDAPVTPLMAPDPNDLTYPKLAFEDQGTIKAMYGFGKARLDSGNRIIKVQHSVPIPDYANRATVFLNGWKLNYLGGDQHVLGLGTVLAKINPDLRNRTLNWHAVGLLRDDDFEEGYEFTYYYTVIAWNDAALNASVDSGSADKFCSTDTDLPDKSFLAFSNGTTALSSFGIFSQTPATPSSQPVAVLPRGFGFSWYGGDHHLLQLGYNLDHSEIFAEKDKIYNNNKDHVRTVGDLFTGISAPLPSAASLVDSGFMSWNTYAILKDDSDRRDYVFTEAVSGLFGLDVHPIQPPFSILPIESASGGFDGAGVKSKDIVIDMIPYEYAIPMLTGWEVGYTVSDQHVKEIGIWIDEIHYRDQNDPPGRLRYKVSSVLHDDDTYPDNYFRHKVTILGLGPKSGVVEQRAVDLLPFSPMGTSPTAFCRIEESGKVLRVTVKNQGAIEAGASKTTVRFDETLFTLDTPPVPAGGSVDLLFKVPTGCFTPDCSFTISVDSSNQVGETNEGNNKVTGGCLG
jgi:hypothetical protein